MEIEFTKKALEDLNYWKRSADKRVQKKIERLILSIKNSPFTGIGKPEALKHELSSRWSRRIDREHRMVYKVDTEKQTVVILQCRFHY